MEKDLTKESREALKQLYDVYTQRRKDGAAKSVAVNFTASAIDISREIKQELKAAGYIKIFIDGDYQLLDKAIIFFENYVKDSVVEWLDRGISALTGLL